MSKTAVITGATSGIGKAIADTLILNNVNVVLNGRSISRSIENERIVTNNDDLINTETADILLNTALDTFGRVDYLFVNAGVIESASIEDIDIDKMCYMMRLKVEAAFRLIYTFLKHMKKENCGHIFITSSVLGTKTRDNSGAYSAANFALEALAESLRMELSDTNVQITSLSRDWSKPICIETGPFIRSSCSA